MKRLGFLLVAISCLGAVCWLGLFSSLRYAHFPGPEALILQEGSPPRVDLIIQGRFDGMEGILILLPVNLEQRIFDWEMLYITLVGRRDRIRNMTGDEIRTLLDPMVDPKIEEEPVELVEQLDELRRELAGQPLRIKWQQVSPLHLEADGILDYVDQLKTRLIQLPDRHKQETPYWLAEARHQRRQAEVEVLQGYAQMLRQSGIKVDTKEGLKFYRGVYW